MRAAVSVIIPTLNAQEVLPKTLASLVEGVQADLIRDVTISDGGSTDATLTIAEAWGCAIISGTASRGGQLKRGCADTSGDWLLVLHADTVLAPGWAEAVQQHLTQPKAGWFHLRFDQGGVSARIVAAWANLRSHAGLPYGDQGILISRRLYDAVGGYAEQPLMEDVALARQLKGQMRPIGAVAITSAQKYRRRGWVRQGARNLWMLTRYFCGASPTDLARAYRKAD